MKRLLIVIITLFLVQIIHSKEIYTKLLNEGDYYRAAGAYKEYAFNNGITDSNKGIYYSKLSAIYSLSDFSNISDENNKNAVMYVKNKSDFDNLAIIRSYNFFKESMFYDALFEIESFNSDDSLYIAIKFFNDLLERENNKTIIIPSFFPDSVKNELKYFFKNIKVKSTVTAFVLSSIIPGLGEAYAHNYKSATRDFFVTTSVYILTAYVFLKDKHSASLDTFELSADYFKTRDWGTLLLVYNFLFTRFQNGTRVNAQDAVLHYNDELYNKNLKRTYTFIDNLYRKKIMDIIEK